MASPNDIAYEFLGDIAFPVAFLLEQSLLLKPIENIRPQRIGHRPMQLRIGYCEGVCPLMPDERNQRAVACRVEKYRVWIGRINDSCEGERFTAL
jgi:hypothetical protein